MLANKVSMFVFFFANMKKYFKSIMFFRFKFYAIFRCNFNVGDLVTSVGRLWPWSRLFVADHSDLVKVLFSFFLLL